MLDYALLSVGDFNLAHVVGCEYDPDGATLTILPGRELRLSREDRDSFRQQLREALSRQDSGGRVARTQIIERPPHGREQTG